MSIPLRGNKGPLILGAEVNRGGEGGIFRLDTSHGNRSQFEVVKLYKDVPFAEKRFHKIMHLVRNPPTDVAILHHETRRMEPLLAWPSELVFTQQNQFIGFVMPFVAGAIQLQELCLTSNPVCARHGREWQRFLHNEPDSQRLRFHIARNLASAVAALHKKGHYTLVDLKPPNVMVRANGLITLVDIDSIQVCDAGVLRYPCTVATPSYTPPEEQLQRRDLSRAASVSWDLFSYAVIVYELLLGIHPFAGPCIDPQTGAELTVPEDKIARRLFPMGSGRYAYDGVAPPHRAFLGLPLSVRELFMACFDAGATNPHLRPSAQTWYEVLGRVLANPGSLGTAGFVHRGPSAGYARPPVVRAQVHPAPAPWAGPQLPSPGTPSPSPLPLGRIAAGTVAALIVFGAIVGAISDARARESQATLQAAALAQQAEAVRAAERARVSKELAGSWILSLGAGSELSKLTVAVASNAVRAAYSHPGGEEVLSGSILADGQVQLINNRQYGRIVQPGTFYGGDFGQIAWLRLGNNGNTLLVRFVETNNGRTLVLNRAAEATNAETNQEPPTPSEAHGVRTPGATEAPTKMEVISLARGATASRDSVLALSSNVRQKVASLLESGADDAYVAATLRLRTVLDQVWQHEARFGRTPDVTAIRDEAASRIADIARLCSEENRVNGLRGNPLIPCPPQEVR